jgi:hypothetical protein
MSKYSHPGQGVAIDAESLALQEDRSLVEDIDLLAAFGGTSTGWRTSTSSSRTACRPSSTTTNVHQDLLRDPGGRGDELARKS